MAAARCAAAKCARCSAASSARRCWACSRPLAAGDGERLLDESARIAAFSPDFGGVLDELASVLHRLQLLQLIPGYQPAEGADDDHALAPLAAQMSPEDVQL